jgi:protoporphyrinogen oxidase
VARVEQTKYLIVGGGITGLSFAEAVPSDDYWVLEALSDVGGYCQTIHQDGFVWDYSGHFFHFRNKDIEAHLVGRIGRERVRTVEKLSQIYWDGGYVDFPFQKNIHQLPREDFIDCLVDLVEKEERTPDNFKDMLYVKFGRGISERFLVPYNEKLYATDLSNLDVDAMGRFFPHAEPKAIISGFRASNNQSYNSTFTYPEGGAIEYVRATQAGVKADRIGLEEAVVSIDTAKKTVRTTKRSLGYEHLISSAPFPKLVELVGQAVPPETYNWNKVLVFNLGFDKKGPANNHWIYFPQREISFYRIGFYDNILDTSRMSLYIELGYSSDAPLDAATIEAARARVLADLAKVGVVTDQKLVSHHHVVLDPAYVHITQRSINAVAEKKAELAKKGVHSIGRYGSWTYCSIEDNIIEARELAKSLS